MIPIAICSFRQINNQIAAADRSGQAIWFTIVANYCGAAVSGRIGG